jgi:hypothetical protein
MDKPVMMDLSGCSVSSVLLVRVGENAKEMTTPIPGYLCPMEYCSGMKNAEATLTLNNATCKHHDSRRCEMRPWRDART